MHNGAAGPTSLNEALQAVLNPGGTPLAHPEMTAALPYPPRFSGCSEAPRSHSVLKHFLPI